MKLTKCPLQITTSSDILTLMSVVAQAIMLLDFSLADQLFYTERSVDWGNLEIAYFNRHAQGCHQDFQGTGYRQGIGRVLTSYEPPLVVFSFLFENSRGSWSYRLKQSPCPSGSPV